MKNLTVIVPPVATLIKASPGFEKKELAEFKLDALALCGFGCRYCSSNWGNYARINREAFAEITEEQLGTRHYPDTTPELTLQFPDPVSQLRRELAGKRKSWGEGKTLVFSMLTDGFSPNLVRDGTTKAILEQLLERSSFRIRILTKNAIVGSDEWLRFFERSSERFVVGLSIGTANDSWATRVEIGTSLPSARLRALARLQGVGVKTFGMLCPVFPEVLEGDQLEQLVDAIDPGACEYVWAEPYNDRVNWKFVRDGYVKGSPGYSWFTEAFENRNTTLWSAYALDLYERLRVKGEHEGWLSKLRYLLYERDVANEHASKFGDLSGILLQSKPDEDGRSQHPHFRALQIGRGAA
jgi:DNA repair photolyase